MERKSRPKGHQCFYKTAALRAHQAHPPETYLNQKVTNGSEGGKRTKAGRTFEEGNMSIKFIVATIAFEGPHS